jgi:hypothetical protein
MSATARNPYGSLGITASNLVFWSRSFVLAGIPIVASSVESLRQEIDDSFLRDAWSVDRLRRGARFQLARPSVAPVTFAISASEFDFTDGFYGCMFGESKDISHNGEPIAVVNTAGMRPFLTSSATGVGSLVCFIAVLTLAHQASERGWPPFWTVLVVVVALLYLWRFFVQPFRAGLREDQRDGKTR